MTGERIAWAAVAAVLGQVLLSVGQVSPDLPVFMLQVASSAALAACVTAGMMRAQDALAARRAAAVVAGLAVASTGGGKSAAVQRHVRGFLRRHPDAEISVYDAKGGGPEGGAP